MKVYTATIVTKENDWNHYAGKSYWDVFVQVFDYVRSWWDKEIKDRPMPENMVDAIREYFEEVEDEMCSIASAEIKTHGFKMDHWSEDEMSYACSLGWNVVPEGEDPNKPVIRKDGYGNKFETDLDALIGVRHLALLENEVAIQALEITDDAWWKNVDGEVHKSLDAMERMREGSQDGK